jgi:hypothetical protein
VISSVQNFVTLLLLQLLDHCELSFPLVTFNVLFMFILFHRFHEWVSDRTLFYIFLVTGMLSHLVYFNIILLSMPSGLFL